MIASILIMKDTPLMAVMDGLPQAAIPGLIKTRSGKPQIIFADLPPLGRMRAIPKNNFMLLI
jgi:hypothetical protein